MQTVACVNCKKFGHPANFRGCPYLVYAQDEIDGNRETNRQIRESKIKKLTNFAVPNRSYAQAINYANPPSPQFPALPPSRFQSNMPNQRHNQQFSPNFRNSPRVNKQSSFFEDSFTKVFDQFKQQMLQSFALFQSQFNQQLECIKSNIAENERKLNVIANKIEIEWS